MKEDASIFCSIQTSVGEWRPEDVPGEPFHPCAISPADCLLRVQLEGLACSLRARVVIVACRFSEEADNALSATWADGEDATDAGRMEVCEPWINAA